MKSLDNHPRCSLDILRLRFIKIDGADLLLKRLRRGICIILNGSIPLEKASGNLVDMNICRLRREHGGNEQFKRGLKVKGGHGVRIFPLQPAEALPYLFIILHVIWNSTLPAKNQTGPSLCCQENPILLFYPH